MRKNNVIMLLAGIIAGILVGTIWISVTADARMIKEYVGSIRCSSYHVSDNTPRGSRETSSGARATEYHTVAVDMHNPRFKQGQKLYIEGFGNCIVEDVGDLNRCGVELDLFTAEDDGFKEYRDVWKVRPETAQEKAERKERERKKRQKGEYLLMYDSSLAPWQIITDPDYIAGGTVQIGWVWNDVVKTEEGLGKVIKTGWRPAAYISLYTPLGSVFEEAVG